MDTETVLREIILKHFNTTPLSKKLPLIDYRDENVFQNLYFFFLETIEKNDFPLLTKTCRQAKNDLESYYPKQCLDICRSFYSKLHALEDEKTKLIEAKMKGDKENMKDKVMITELNEEIVELKEKVTKCKEINRNLNDKIFRKNSIDKERARIILKPELEELKEKLENEKCKYKKQLEQFKKSSSASSLDMNRSLVSNESLSTINIESYNVPSFSSDRSFSVSTHQMYDKNQKECNDELTFEKMLEDSRQDEEEMRKQKVWNDNCQKLIEEKKRKDEENLHREEKRRNQIRKENEKECQPLLDVPLDTSHQHDAAYQAIMDASEKP